MNALTEEEQLAQVVNQALGPFVAVGKPGEPLPELGAARLYVTDDEWQTTVADLMRRASLVILRAGETEGFWWEVQRAVTELRPQQLVFLIPERPEAYARFRERAERYLRCQLPETFPRAGQDDTLDRGSGWSRVWLTAWSFLVRGARAMVRQERPSTVRGLVHFRSDWTPSLVPIDFGSLGSPRRPLVRPLRRAFAPVFAGLTVA